MIRTVAFALLASTMLAGTPAAFAQTAARPAAAPKAATVAELIRPVNIPYEKFTLPNGLTVLVHTDRKAPIVAVSTWYDVGSKHEPKGKTGFAHLFEHLMFNGSENAQGDFFAPLRAVGATDFNGTTNSDRTNYFETVPKAALERALFLESDRMGYLLGAVTQTNLDNQIGVVQNEKRQGDNQPYGLVRYKMVEGLFPEGHPYHHSTIGSMADLSAATLDDVKNWFRSHYGPNNAVLVLAGDVDAAEARTLVTKYFGAIPKGPETVTPNITVPTLAQAKSEVMKDRVATTRIYRMWAVPGMRDAESAQLQVAASVLGGLSSSRLDNALVRKEKVAVSVAAFNQSLVQAGIFGIQMDVRPGVDPTVAAQRLDAVIADFLRTGPTADEVARTATVAVSGTVAGLESVGGFGGKAVALAQGELFVGDPEYYKKRLNAIASSTPASVKASATKWLSRPVYALTVVDGERDAYVEAAPVAARPKVEEKPFQGTRGEMPAVADVGPLDFPKVERTTLSNGIEVVYARRTAVPVTQIVASFDAGVAADPAGKLGTQNMTLAVMDEGTATRDSIALAEAQERLGARIGSGNDADRTYVSVFMPSANLDAGAELLADVARNPAFADAEVERIRAQQLARIAAERTSPQGIGQMALPPLLFGAKSPYAKTAAGTGDPAAVKALTRTDLVAFHQAWIRPEKAKLFVTSDRPLAEVKASLDRRFGDWRAAGTAGSKTFGQTAQAARGKIVLLDRPNSPQSFILAGQLTGLKSSQDLLSTTTANQVLGQGFLSRINMDLREDKGWSYGVRGGFSQMENAVPYIITAPVQADQTGPSIAALRQQVGDFLTTRGVTGAEFEREITGNVRGLAGSYETSNAILNAMQANDLYGRPDDYQATLAQKYRSFTAPQLDAAARAAIKPDQFVYVVVGDAKVVRPQLDKLGMPVEVVATAAPAPAAPARPGQ